jgi:hypothetical protein
MMPLIFEADDLALRLPNRPGAMAALLRAFDDAGVALHGLCGVVAGELDVDHFLVDDPAAAEAAASRAAASDTRLRRVVVVELRRLGVDAVEVVERIAAAGISVDLVYLASNGALVLGVDDLATARATLRLLPGAAGGEGMEA